MGFRVRFQDMSLGFRVRGLGFTAGGFGVWGFGGFGGFGVWVFGALGLWGFQADKGLYRVLTVGVV